MGKTGNADAFEVSSAKEEKVDDFSKKKRKGNEGRDANEMRKEGRCRR